MPGPRGCGMGKKASQTRKPGHPPSSKSLHPTKHFPHTRPCNCGPEPARRLPDDGVGSKRAFSFGMPGIGGLMAYDAFG